MEQQKGKSRVDRYAYLIVLCAFLINFAANYPQYQLSPLATQLMPAMNISVAQFSSLFSSAMIPGILLGIVAGVLCDRFGAKACIAVAGVISLIGVVGRIFATNYTMLFICMLLSGVVATFLNSNLAKITGSWFPPENIGTAVGIALAGSTAAMAVGMGTTAMMPSMTTAFVVAVVVSVVTLAFWLIFMKNRPDAAPGAAMPPMPQMSVKDGLLKVAKNKNIWIVGLSVGFVLAANMCLNTFLPQALQAVRGMDAVAAGATSSVIMFGNIAGSILGPVLCARMGRMKPYLLLFCIIAAVGVAFSWRAPEGAAMMVCLFVTGFVFSGLISQLVSIPVMLPGIGPAFAGSAGGFVGTLQLICGVVIPSYIIAPITGDNFTLIYIIAGVLALAAGLLSLILPELLGRSAPERA